MKTLKEGELYFSAAGNNVYGRDMLFKIIATVPNSSTQVVTAEVVLINVGVVAGMRYKFREDVMRDFLELFKSVPIPKALFELMRSIALAEKRQNLWVEGDPFPLSKRAFEAFPIRDAQGQLYTRLISEKSRKAEREA